ncbi:hypothetical protein MPSEU_000564600 [Mayamaea pseudoterrestris]|nr:hypothetical protein MPSEU_000564600 [Mayamaea pseudoterrestris]
MSATLMFPTSPALIPSVLSNGNHPPVQLRRANYIHVSDLTNAYNMDHARLDEELARVKAQQVQQKQRASNSKMDASSSSSSTSGVPTELTTSHAQRRLQPPRSGYNLCVLVGQVKIVVDKSRVDGSRVRLAEVEVGDETGVVSLRARDDQIDMLRQLSDKQGTVVLRNCTLELYQGKHIRLAVTKWGKLCVYPDQIASTPPPPSKINRDRNFSLIDLTVVASELVGNEQYTYSQNQQASPDSDQPSPLSGPRTPQYNNYRPHHRHQKGGRRPPTYSKTGGNSPGYTEHYSDHQGLNYGVPTYHQMAAMQGYAEVSPYSYGQSESLTTSQHQVVYHRQHYQMQRQHQRQLQHMYSSSSEHQRQQGIPQSPNLTPGFDQTTTFDSFGVAAIGLLSDNYMSSPFAVSNPSPTSRLIPGSTPPSPGMNPKATTYDYDYNKK